MMSYAKGGGGGVQVSSAIACLALGPEALNRSGLDNPATTVRRQHCMIDRFVALYRRWILIVTLLAAWGGCLPFTVDAQPSDSNVVRTTLGLTTVALHDSTLRVTVRNIDITRFPLISVVFDVFDTNNVAVTGIDKSDVIITENGQRQEIIALSTVTSSNRVPVDFVFLIDQTGSMGSKIDAVKQNIEEFTTRLTAKGIDYRLGMIAFDDNVADRHWLTDNLQEFKGWVGALEARGGGDVKENALEALRAATSMNFRSSANRCVVLITDAPYHQYGEHGYGTTNYTTSTMTQLLARYDMRTFCIVSTAIVGYRAIADGTGGQVFDIEKPFAEILNSFISTMTSLNTVTYRTKADLIPDSIRVELKIPNAGITVHKNFAVLEVGRKLVVDNIRFETNQYVIEQGSQASLDYLIRLMKARPSLKLRIEGFTDNMGDHLHNMKLSQARADAVKRYMTLRGIAPARFSTIGYGETRPTASNDTEEGRRLNRRTEFIIVSR
ncbi:MAG: OmpA family protein [Bacteroidetes bacterium]|nr:OmpA family protein [Bacteroidota bacterium]